MQFLIIGYARLREEAFRQSRDLTFCDESRKFPNNIGPNALNINEYSDDSCSSWAAMISGVSKPSIKFFSRRL